ncbi:MAG: hypothetical protein HRU71_09270 [Planctomycetia bacterium]|nr:MAG: hypothetical protein HRU71_09270 [Planctomycetia bacterium]
MHRMIAEIVEHRDKLPLIFVDKTELLGRQPKTCVKRVRKPAFLVEGRAGPVNNQRLEHHLETVMQQNEHRLRARAFMRPIEQLNRELNAFQRPATKLFHVRMNSCVKLCRIR